MGYLKHYLKKIETTKDSFWLKEEVHKMAMVIAAPAADPTKDPLVAAAFEVMPILVDRINLIEEAEKKGASNDTED